MRPFVWPYLLLVFGLFKHAKEEEEERQQQKQQQRRPKRQE